MKNRKLKNSELKRINNTEFKSSKKTPLIVILDNIRSLNNIGSVFRTSDAFLIEKIYLCGITAKPPHKDIHKTALGATDSVKWEYVENTIELINRLKSEGVKVASIEQAERATMLNAFKVESKSKYAIIHVLKHPEANITPKFIATNREKKMTIKNQNVKAPVALLC